MAVSPAAGSAPLESRGATLRRDAEHGVVAGVCAGIARRLDFDPLLVRLAFLVATFAGGLGIALYALGWLALPADPDAEPSARRMRSGRGSVEVALGVGLLLLAVLLGFRALGLWFSDALVWPVVLVASGAALLWRTSLAPAGGDSQGAMPAAAADAVPASHPSPAGQPASEAARARVSFVSRAGVGIALVIAAGLAFLQATGSLSAARDVVLAALVVAIALGVIFAPLVLRLARSLSAERRERIRSQERAEMAAHVHDSVLQTLALMQKRAADPREVAALARRQERELRSWLSGMRTANPGARLAGALDAAAEEVEREHGLPIEVVTVGDRDLDERAGAVVAAAREAMLNAAKFGGGSPIDVYAEAGAGRLQVFVRDRGPGFDPAELPSDRRGVSESIVGRMERHGGSASIRSSPDSGTEVELVLEDRP